MNFEQAMVRHGIVIAKFWLAMTKGEQLRRFKEREKVVFKRFKIRGRLAQPQEAGRL
jgi:AMP-polyphosphate phosphotransferase